MNYKFQTNSKKIVADTFTPVSIYLKIRDRYPNSILLESSDYHGNENSFSYLCFSPVSSIEINNGIVTVIYPDNNMETYELKNKKDAIRVLSEYSKKFEGTKNEYPFINNGLFGHITYDAIRYFEDIELNSSVDNRDEIPQIKYTAFKYVLAFNHFKEELFLFEHCYNGEKSKMDDVLSLINNKSFPSFKFKSDGGEVSNFSDEEFIRVVAEGKKHCKRGDVFQIVLSRAFKQRFKGDEFNVYRALRSVNPSPYLFYFDYGSYKLMGSSPEAQIVLGKSQASIHPIAGTFRRTGDAEKDKELALQLSNDAKENAEHVMLVDLARNDLSRNCENVKVEIYKEVQFYSHVIHLVSKVTGTVSDKSNSFNVVADTFPAGTLSGAPKHKAMQLIDRIENLRRGFYGGAIGFMGFNGAFNHAIMIRSFMSKNNCLYYRAGAGVVDSSVEVSELNEVTNKLAALRKAIELAHEI